MYITQHTSHHITPPSQLYCHLTRQSDTRMLSIILSGGINHSPAIRMTRETRERQTIVCLSSQVPGPILHSGIFIARFLALLDGGL